MADVRARKRRRPSPEPEPSPRQSTRRAVLEQLDLELAIRARLADAAHARIAWAAQLTHALHSGARPDAGTSAGDFAARALGALRAAEAPVLPVLSHEAQLPRLRAAPARTAPSTPAAAAPPEPSSSFLPARASRSARPRPAAAAPKRLLYLRNTASSPPTLARLACPTCAKSDFSSLQGLYNHARLRHAREFGSHDECVRACAVRVEAGDEARVAREGVELPGASLPGLRAIFERAVGVGGQELSRNLGLHAETPALAPFLGREAKRRSIAVHATDDLVDIEGMNPAQGRVWRKPWAHRSRAGAAILGDAGADAAGEAHSVSTAAPTLLPAATAGAAVEGSGRSAPSRAAPAAIEPGPAGPTQALAAGTRFHFTARVAVGDRSLWIARGGAVDVPEGHTHRCMIYADAPSYSVHVSTFISQISVRSLTDPPPSTLQEPMTVSAYPFVATLTTDRPFLAELTLSFIGERNAPMVVQHWVELDPLRREKSVLGEEQALDVELDRSAAYPPPQPHVDPAALLNTSRQRAPQPAAPDPAAEDVPPYAQLLRTLLPRFPMIARDAKAGFSTLNLPYRLMPTQHALRSLTYGRRKAIERGRAQALADAYSATRAAMDPQEAAAHLELSAADVYIWLDDAGHFLRPPPRAPAQAPAPASAPAQQPSAPRATTFCATCGADRALHPQPDTGAPCPYAPPPPRMLVLDPDRAASTLAQRIPPPRAPERERAQEPPDARALLASAHPRLIDAAARAAAPVCSAPLGTPAAAALALAARAFARRVVHAAAGVAARDWAGVPGVGAGARGGEVRAVLAPAHVMRAMGAEPTLFVVGAMLGSARARPVELRPLEARPLDARGADDTTGPSTDATRGLGTDAARCSVA